MCKPLLAILAVVSFWGLAEAGQAPGSASTQTTKPPEIRAVVQEVLLDVIVRDRRGRPIEDLKPEEIEVYEEGAPQKLTSFRLLKAEETAAAAQPPGPEAAAPLDPLKELHLVTLLFERLGNEGRILSKQAAMHLIKNQLQQNVYFSVFINDQRLFIVQPFTNDRVLLKKAIDRATSGAYTQYAAQSDAVLKELQTLIASSPKGAPQPPAVSPGQMPDTRGMGAAFAAAKMAEIAVNILKSSESLSRVQQSRSSIFSLLSIAREQRTLPGRKTVLYFSEGLWISQDMVENFRTTISEANRANVSFYSIDARGLQVYSDVGASRDIAAEAANASREQQMTGSGRAVRREEAVAFDTAQDSTRANVQQNLGDLAGSTGGFLIANTNDLRLPVKHIAEDVLTYYVLAYRPQLTEYDGRFRKISVRVLRPDVIVQARSGYFALPPAAGGSPVLPFELPLLGALTTSPLPQAFDYRATALHFAAKPEGVRCALLVEVPQKNFTITPDQSKKTFSARFSLLGVVKNAEGQIVQKFSQDIPVQAPLDKVEGFQVGVFSFTPTFDIVTGKYTLETAVIDRSSMKVSARRSEFTVPASKTGVAVSSISLIRRVDSQSGGNRNPDDPFQFQGGKVTPTLGEPIKRGPGAGLALYFVIYPSREMAEKPQLVLEFFQGGDQIGQAPLELPAADADGRIPYIAEFPVESFEPGQYEVRAVVRQGSSTAQEGAQFTVIP